MTTSARRVEVHVEESGIPEPASPMGPNAGRFFLAGARRLPFWLLLLAVAVYSGVRFSDGSMLVAISKGYTSGDPALNNAMTQYLWDSPLKVLFLQRLPAKAIPIAVAFMVLATLPIAGLFTRSRLLTWAAVVTLFFTSAFKVSIQNIGLGDGLVFSMIILACCSSSAWAVGATLLAATLWHPQQGVFIVASFVVAQLCYVEKPDRGRIMAAVAALVLGELVFLVYKSSLPFTYQDRTAYLVSHLAEFLLKNLLVSVLAFAATLMWFLLFAPAAVRFSRLIPLWVGALGLVALITTDVTRVMTVISLPLVLIGARRLFEQGVVIDQRKLIAGMVFVALLPVYSWSGFDFLLYRHIFYDLCKWQGMYCPS